MTHPCPPEPPRIEQPADSISSYNPGVGLMVARRQLNGTWRIDSFDKDGKLLGTLWISNTDQRPNR